jgi:hypothetical protein
MDMVRAGSRGTRNERERAIAASNAATPHTV